MRHSGGAIYNKRHYDPLFISSSISVYEESEQVSCTRTTIESSFPDFDGLSAPLCPCMVLILLNLSLNYFPARRSIIRERKNASSIRILERKKAPRLPPLGSYSYTPLSLLALSLLQGR